MPTPSTTASATGRNKKYQAAAKQEGQQRQQLQSMSGDPWPRPPTPPRQGSSSTKSLGIRIPHDDITCNSSISQNQSVPVTHIFVPAAEEDVSENQNQNQNERRWLQAREMNRNRRRRRPLQETNHRLRELKEIQAKWKNLEEPADSSVTTPLDNSADTSNTRIPNGLISMTVPLTFIVMFSAFYAVNYDTFFSTNCCPMKNVLCLAAILFIFGCLHSIIVEKLAVSIYQKMFVDRAPILRISEQKHLIERSSETHKYIMDQIHQNVKILSGGMILTVTVKAAMVKLFKAAIPFLNDQNQYPIWNQIVHDTKSIMSYSVVFIALCCVFIPAICLPKDKVEKTSENTHDSIGTEYEIRNF